MKHASFLVAAVCVLFTVQPAPARVKLTALPDRLAMVSKLATGLPTLIEEERVLSLQQGTNEVDFSWKGVFVDADSIRIRILEHPERASLISVSYPPGENALTWRIYCETPLVEKVRISYLLHHIDSLVAYQALADRDETRMDLKVYAVLRNFSGEEMAATEFKFDFGPTLATDLAHGETRRALLTKTDGIPIRKEFTFDARALPWDPEKEADNVGIPLRYVFSNTAAHGLGAYTIEPGKVRLFQQDGRGSRIFLGEDTVSKRVPKGDDIRLYVGDSRDIVVTQRFEERKRTHIRRNNDNQVVLYDLRERLAVQVENFKDKPCELRLIETIEGEWEMLEAPPDYEQEAHDRIVFTMSLGPREKKAFAITYLKKNLRP